MTQAELEHIAETILKHTTQTKCRSILLWLMMISCFG